MADDSVFSIPLSPHFDPKSHSSPIHVNAQTNKPPVFSSLSSTRSSSKHSTISGSSRPRTSDSKPLPGKKQNLRTLVINCNGVSNKRAELENVFNYTDPDIVLLTETKIDSTINPSEFLPRGYKGDIRKDRCQGGGGVMIVSKDSIPIQPVNMESECESVWGKISLKDKSDLYIGSFYRRPNEYNTSQIEDLEQDLNHISDLTKNNDNYSLILGGDFNARDIDWLTHSIKFESTMRPLCEKILSVFADFNLEQLQREPTRGKNVLDYICTNKPGLAKSTHEIPGISDHEIIVFDSDLRARYTRREPRKIYMYSKADWDSIRENTKNFVSDLLDSFSLRNVNENYEKIKIHIDKIINDHIPSKLSSSRFNVPWITNSIRRMCRKKQRLYNRAKRTHKSHHWGKFRAHKKDTLRALRRARWNYINNILELSLTENNSKPFWKYIKAQRQDNIGVTALKSEGRLFTDNVSKAEILNRQFKSVFTQEDKSSIPKLPGPPHPPIGNMEIDTRGVEKLLTRLDPNKASGPDNISCRILKELAIELAPALTAIYQQSIDSGSLPSDWTRANITPVYKKGNKNLAENYRPVSLTCVACKIMEHIICSHIHKHLEHHNILTSLQHGFRAKHSCETQLLITLFDILSSRDKKVQVDVMVLDFSKAFDTVPHVRLLSKLEHYGITGPILNWISVFLKGREQRVLVGGAASSQTSVDSGVPQGTVLGPLLFLLHINDLPQVVSSQVRLFADDCLLYRDIRCRDDQVALQRDLDALRNWGDIWGMRFNAAKCNVLRISRSKTPHTNFYTLGGHILDEVNQAKYLGITITNELSWSAHTDITTNKAHSTLGFLRRNLRGCPSKLKETAYISLVRSTLEYAATVWDPELSKDTNALEKVQRKAARFVKHDFDRFSSVTSMLHNLGWKQLADRRRDLRLALLYKITHNQIAVPAESLCISKPARELRAKHKYKYHIPRAITTELKTFFVHRTIPEWNSLPACVAEAETLTGFKSQLAKLEGLSA